MIAPRKRHPAANVAMIVLTALIVVLIAIMVVIIVTGVDRWV